MKNKNSKKGAANPISDAVKAAAPGEKGNPVTLNQKHHKKAKKVYE